MGHPKEGRCKPHTESPASTSDFLDCLGWNAMKFRGPSDPSGPTCVPTCPDMSQHIQCKGSFIAIWSWCSWALHLPMWRACGMLVCASMKGYVSQVLAPGNTGTIALNSICKYMLLCAIYHTCLLPLKFWETGCALPNSRNLTTKWSVQGQECRKCGVLQHQTTIMVNRSAKCPFSSQHKHGGFVVAVTGYGILGRNLHRSLHEAVEILTVTSGYILSFHTPILSPYSTRKCHLAGGFHSHHFTSSTLPEANSSRCGLFLFLSRSKPGNWRFWPQVCWFPLAPHFKLGSSCGEFLLSLSDLAPIMRLHLPPSVGELRKNGENEPSLRTMLYKYWPPHRLWVICLRTIVFL